MEKLPINAQSEINKVSQIAGYLWQREWAERNAGNISIDMTHLFDDQSMSVKSEEIAFPLPKEAAGMVLFVTGTGCHLRHLVDRVKEVACILKVNLEATGYAIVWGGEKVDFRPTSELISHVKIHLFNRGANPTHKAIVHTHPTELIVMSHHPIFQEEDKFNHSLWKMCPEVRVFVPKGVDCTPYALSGTEALADVTIEGLKNRDVILWEKHGALSTGSDVETAFDYLDVANKGAKLLLTAWSAGFDPIGLLDDQMEELEVLMVEMGLL
ncbi:rhamnulose-1-phosphate aldolase [Persicobacter psychrovividus]|uniref:Rhamnulose-1-phosphate aldolase n=1 Tax=Persicobacter psychrovividus TaxID=387638 RepID=A0ABN6LGI0_9BACT|nr:rhamnulose-1-phosphate aldolase [Persicobacter psychrovividus]